MKAAKPSFRPVGKSLSACTRCGAVVSDERTHRRWHEQLEARPDGAAPTPKEP